MNKFFNLKYLFLMLIVFNVLLASRWIIDGNLFFHTDIARDFLLMEDIANNKHLTLLGPRSGAIPGLFHGPLWLYLNLPSFIIGQGNPVYVGWFWVILYISSLYIIYYVGKKLFDEQAGLLSASLLSSVTILDIRALFNPYGALILSPLFFYFLVEYLKNQKIIILILDLFILGLIIQFQMAFGMPILVLTLVYLVYFLYKNKKLPHLVSFLILLIPLSSFIIFDLRNKFLQFNSLINYVWGNQEHGKLGITLTKLILLRVKELIFDGLGALTQNNNYLTVPLFLLLLYAIYKLLKTNDARFRNYIRIFFLFLYFYTGFWIFTVFFKGTIWSYYYMPFIPLIILILISTKQIVNKTLLYIFISAIFLLNALNGFKDIVSYNPDVTKQDVSTWKFNKLVAETVFVGEEEKFGYFIFTPDLYGYSPRYAFDYFQKKNKQKSVKPYEKEEVTYLVIAPPPEYGKDPNSIWYQKNTNSKLWKTNDIKITKNPVSVTSFKNGFVIEKYILSDEEVKVAPNPFLIKDIFFR